MSDSAVSSLTALLDQIPVVEIETYLRDREREERLRRGVVDGWERLTSEVDMPMDPFGVTIEEESWVWRDDAGRIRRVFGWLGSSYVCAMTFDAEGRDLASWELRDDDGLMERVGGYGELDLDSEAHLALIRETVMAAPIERVLPEPANV